MLRVLLVQPPHRDTFGYSMPPIGPLHLGAAAQAEGHNVRFLDLALEVRRGDLIADDTLIEHCAERILAEEPEVLGLGAMISSMPATLHLAAAVKTRRPDLPIILGGQGPETVEEAIIARYPAIDAVAVGEAEQTFVEWLAVLDDTHNATEASDLLARSAACDVPGLVVRRDNAPHRTAHRPVIANLDEVPPPAWELAESPRAYARAADAHESLFPLDLGRGCTFDCSFCTTPGFWDRSARQLSPQQAADAFDQMATLEGLDCVYVTHDLFTVDRERVLAICAEKKRRGNTLPWECRTRLDLVDRELLEAMRAAGCRRILYGVESDAAPVLEQVRKGGATKTLDVRETLAMASEVGMASILGLMCGIPGETQDDVEANLQLAAEAAVLDGVSLSLHWFNVTPGNGCANALGDTLQLSPGIHADLVRGHDLPAGHVHSAQAKLIAEDSEVFGAFRVFTPDSTPGVTPRSLSLLTRNAHLLLEVLPRTLRALAAHQECRLREVLDTFLEHAYEDGDLELWEETYVLRRAPAVRRLANEAARCGDLRIASLAQYERTLFETTTRQLVRFDIDPLPIVRAMDATAAASPGVTSLDALPQGGLPRAVLFARQGEWVRAVTLSDFLADAADEPDDERLMTAWPDADATLLARARQQLRDISPPSEEHASS
jgi:radical SAM superfamily enzyme YgiQ (UPF0313 family)